jgi:hypothetical protein
MVDFKWKCKQYQLKTGKWVPEVYLYEHDAGELKVTSVLAPKGIEFDSEDEARSYSEAMAKKWLKDKYL